MLRRTHTAQDASLHSFYSLSQPIFNFCLDSDFMVIFSYLSLLFLDSTSKITKFCASWPECAAMVGLFNMGTLKGEEEDLCKGYISCHRRQENYIVISFFSQLFTINSLQLIIMHVCVSICREHFSVSCTRMST